MTASHRAQSTPDDGHDLPCPAAARTGRRNETATALLIAIGFGILFGSVTASRFQLVFGSEAFLPLNRVCSVIVLLALIPGVVRRHCTVKNLLVAAGASWLVHAVAVLLSQVLVEPIDLYALGMLSCAFEGAALGIMKLLYVLWALQLRPRLSVSAIAGGFLCGTVYDCLFMSSPAGAIVAQWLAGKGLSLGLLVWGFARAKIPPVAEVTGVAGVAGVAGGARPVERADGAADADASHGASSGASPLRDPDFAAFAAFMAFALVAMLVQGVFAVATGLGGVGGNAFFGLSTGIVMVVVRCAVLLYCAVCVDRMAYAPTTAAVTTLMVVALSLTSLFRGENLGLAGDLLRETAYYILQVVPLVMAMKVARTRPADRVALIAVALVVSASNHVTRFLCFLLVGGSTALGAWEVGALSFASIAVTAAFSMTAMYFEKPRTASYASSYASSGASYGAASGATPDAAWGPVLTAEIDFSRRFGAVCEQGGLTERERDVVLQAVHGYTIDNIADRLCLSRETVKTTLSKAYARAGVNGKQAFLARMDELELGPAAVAPVPDAAGAR